MESESDVASESEVKEQYMKQIEAMQQIEVILRQVLEPEAKERLSNIKVVNQEMYYKVAQFILQLYQSGRIAGRIDDDALKQLLIRLQSKKEISITRK